MPRAVTCQAKMSHKCVPCQTAYSSAADLRRHEASKRHKKTVGEPVDKPHKCKLCSKGFVQRAQLNEHEKTHGAPQKACGHCPRMFKSQSSLTHHITDAHGGQKAAGNTPPQPQLPLPDFEPASLPHVELMPGLVDDPDVQGALWEFSQMEANTENGHPPAGTFADQAGPSSSSTEQTTSPTEGEGPVEECLLDAFAREGFGVSQEEYGVTQSVQFIDPKLLMSGP